MKFGELTEAEQAKFHKSITQNQNVTPQKPIELWPDDDDEEFQSYFQDDLKSSKGLD